MDNGTGRHDQGGREAGAGENHGSGAGGVKSKAALVGMVAGMTILVPAIL